jgi:hypothetical protein
MSSAFLSGIRKSFAALSVLKGLMRRREMSFASSSLKSILRIPWSSSGGGAPWGNLLSRSIRS